MFALERQNQKDRQYNRSLAWIGCNAGDWLKQGVTPEKLQRFQDATRAELLNVEGRLRNVRGRKSRRAARLPAPTDRTAEFHRKLAAFIGHAQVRESILLTRRAILKQCGDACAWAVLRTDPRLILPLFSETRTQNLSSGIGLVGPIQIMMTAHESGEFLVVENDLTRCLGIGDLTVVRSDGRWVHPLPIEIKTKGRFKEGAVAEVDLITAYSNHPLDEELFQAFSRLLELKERDQPRVTPKIERQSRELQERSKFLLRVTSRAKDVMPFSDRSLWRAMENILEKAQFAGHAYDVIEEGIAFVAVRNRQGDDSKRAMQRVLEQVDGIGFGRDKGYGSVTSQDFQTTDWMSAIAPPIPLWPIQVGIRADLLTGDLFFGSIIDPAVWRRAFESQGVQWREENDHWVLNRNGDQALLDPIEIHKLTVGVALAGYSPREVAATIAQSF